MEYTENDCRYIINECRHDYEVIKRLLTMALDDYAIILRENMSPRAEMKQVKDFVDLIVAALYVLRHDYSEPVRYTQGAICDYAAKKIEKDMEDSAMSQRLYSMFWKLERLED